MARSNKKRGKIIHIQDERNEALKIRKSSVEIIPRNLAQEEYIVNLNDYNKRIVFAIGPAGTGKTYLAVQKAIKDFKENRCERIVITRPAVSNGEKHGFLPGDLNKKMEPWTRPIWDVFEEYFSPKDLRIMLDENIIEIAPLGFMRGRTFKNCRIILDEAQNTTPSQMKMALTRIGEDCRMFITGDLNQSDFHDKNGLVDFFSRFKTEESQMIAATYFGREHIERDVIVTEVLKFYGED